MDAQLQKLQTSWQEVQLVLEEYRDSGLKLSGTRIPEAFASCAAHAAACAGHEPVQTPS